METRNESPDTLALLANAAWVQRLARRLLADAHLAEDVAQDALTAGLDAPEGLRDNAERLRRWLGGVTRHLAARVRQREGERASREAWAANEEAGDGGQDAADRLRLHRRLAEAMLALDEPYRSTLVLRFFDDLAPREIARRQGLPAATVRKRLSRGVAALRRKLDREFEGGRGGWRAALVGLIEASGPAAPGLILSKLSVAAIAALVLVAALVGWRVLEGDGSNGLRAKPAPEVEGVSASPAPDEEAVSAKPPVEVGDSRVAIAGAIAAAELDVLVLAEEGHGLEGAEVFVLAGAELLAKGVTDSGGQTRFEGSSLGGHVIAQAPGRPGALLPLQTLGGEQQIVLPRGTSLSGWLLEDGEVPREPVLLRLHSRDDPLGALDEEVQERLAAEGLRLTRREQRTAHNGSFSFDCLPLDWSGFLAPPDTHWFVETPPNGTLYAEDPTNLRFRSPAAGLTLRATRLPSAQGRVVAADTGEALVDSGLTIQAAFEGGENSPLTSMDTDEEGRFAHGFYDGSSNAHSLWRDPALRPRLESIQLTARARGYLSTHRSFTADEIGASGELGDIDLQRGLELHFAVRDEAGRPVAGAHVLAGTTSSPSDAEGRVVVSGLPFDRETALVGSPYHRIREIPIDQGGRTAQTPIEVVLERGNRLELILVGAPAALTGNLVVQVSSAEPPFELGKSYLFRPHLKLGTGACFTYGWNDEGGSMRFQPDEGGEICLVSLLPEMELLVEVHGSMRHRLLNKTLRTPGFGETVRHELVIEEAPFELETSVRDQAGQPLPSVSLRLRGERGSFEAKTSSDGLGVFEGLYALSEVLALEAVLEGFTPLRIEGISLAPDTRLPELVMERGVTIRVRAIDESGETLPLTWVWGTAPGHVGARGEEVEPGVVLVRDLPSGSVTLETSYGLRDFLLEHDTATGDATFVLPVHGALELELSPGFTRPEDGWIVAKLTAADDSEVGRDLQFAERRGFWDGPLPLDPGPYRLQLQHRQRIQGKVVHELLGRSHEFEILAKKTVVLTLGE